MWAKKESRGSMECGGGKAGAVGDADEKQAEEREIDAVEREVGAEESGKRKRQAKWRGTKGGWT